MKKTIGVFLCLNLFCSGPGYSLPLDVFKSGINRNNFTLFTLNVITRSGRTVKTKVGEADYVGTSQTAPCSDLRLLATGYGNAVIKPGSYPFGADNFAAYPGPGFTCFKMDFKIKGKIYSTGNIQLTWNTANSSYVDANPRVVPLEIDW